jgi:hypothetical protein
MMALALLLFPLLATIFIFIFIFIFLFIAGVIIDLILTLLNLKFNIEELLKIFEHSHTLLCNPSQLQLANVVIGCECHKHQAH